MMGQLEVHAEEAAAVPVAAPVLEAPAEHAQAQAAPKAATVAPKDQHKKEAQKTPKAS